MSDSEESQAVTSSSARTNQVEKYNGWMRVGWMGFNPVMGKYFARMEAITVVNGTLGFPLIDLPA